jgi:hypothetical protein
LRSLLSFLDDLLFDRFASSSVYWNPSLFRTPFCVAAHREEAVPRGEIPLDSLFIQCRIKPKRLGVYTERLEGVT